MNIEKQILEENMCQLQSMSNALICVNLAGQRFAVENSGVSCLSQSELNI